MIKLFFYSNLRVQYNLFIKFFPLFNDVIKNGFRGNLGSVYLQSEPSYRYTALLKEITYWSWHLGLGKLVLQISTGK